MTREVDERIALHAARPPARPRLNAANLERIRDVILEVFDNIEEPAGIDWAEFERRCRERLMRRTAQ
jgi:hypothetical protein